MQSYLYTSWGTADRGTGSGFGSCARSNVSELRTTNSTVANRNPMLFTFYSSGTGSAATSLHLGRLFQGMEVQADGHPNIGGADLKLLARKSFQTGTMESG